MVMSIFVFYYQKKGIPSENPFLFRKEFCVFTECVKVLDDPERDMKYHCLREKEKLKKTGSLIQCLFVVHTQMPKLKVNRLAIHHLPIPPVSVKKDTITAAKFIL